MARTDAPKIRKNAIREANAFVARATKSYEDLTALKHTARVLQSALNKVLKLSDLDP